MAVLTPPRFSRSSALVGYADLAREIGLDPLRQADLAHLPREALSETGLRIPVTASRRLVRDTAAITGVEDFALRLSLRRRLSDFGPVALLVREQPTLGDALRALSRYIGLDNEGLQILLQPHAGLLELHVGVDGSAPSRQRAEGVVATLVLNLRELLNQDWRPTWVAFRDAAPRSASLHHAIFGAPVLFSQAFDGFACTPDDLALPVPGANRALARELEGYAAAMLRRAPDTLADRVMELAILQMARSTPSLDAIAATLGVSGRTLQRRLATHGVTFADLLDAARARLARKYVETTDMQLAQIATLLGYGSQAAFCHWHQERYDESPSARRRRVAAAAGEADADSNPGGA